MYFNTRNYGKAEVLSNGNKYGYLKVRFLNTGHIDEFRKDAVKKGEIRDKYAVSLCGVGIIGNIKTRGINKKYYTIWRNMILRCYGSINKTYQDKVTVCNRWKTFEYFFQDIDKIAGWDRQLFELGELDLDKDTLQRFQDKKIYSLETCKWIPKKLNRCIQDGQQKKFMAISPDGDIYIDSNITKFAREHNLERRQISAVLHKRYKTTMGWSFKYIDKEIV